MRRPGGEHWSSQSQAQASPRLKIRTMTKEIVVDSITSPSKMIEEEEEEEKGAGKGGRIKQKEKEDPGDMKAEKIASHKPSVNLFEVSHFPLLLMNLSPLGKLSNYSVEDTPSLF